MNDREYKPADRSKADTKKKSEQIEDVNQDPAEENAPRIADQPRGSGSGSGSHARVFPVPQPSQRHTQFSQQRDLVSQASFPHKRRLSDSSQLQNDCTSKVPRRSRKYGPSPPSHSAPSSTVSATIDAARQPTRSIPGSKTIGLDAPSTTQTAGSASIRTSSSGSRQGSHSS